MTRKLKKVLALLLTLSMVMSMVTVEVFALGLNERCPFCVTTALIDVPEVPATCQSEGVKGHRMCPSCGRNFHRNTAGAPNVYLDPVPRIDKNPNNHANVVIDAAVPATCIATGLTEGRHCGDCNAVIVEQTEVAVDLNNHAFATSLSYNETHHWYACTRDNCTAKAFEDEHAWDEGKQTTPPTCTAEGVMTYTCAVCSQTKTESIGKIAHTWSTEWSKDETNHWHACTSTGCDARKDEAAHKDEDHDNKCDVCDATICEHDWQEVSTTPATCTTGTITVEKCTKCEYTKTTEADDAAGHTYGELIVEQAATCTVDGVKAHYVCSVCEKLFDENKEETTEEALVIKAPGTHTWTEGAVNTETYERVDTCQKGDATRTVSLVARIGDVYFETLQAAINAAGNGDTVEVLKDCVGAALQTANKITVNIPEGVTVSTNTGKNYALAVDGEGAELTITGEGTIQGSTYGVVAQSKGKLNVTSGTITAAGGTAKLSNGTIISISRAINAASGGIVNVSGGTIIGANKDYSAGIYATGTGTTVNVSGGEVKSVAEKPAEGWGYYGNTFGLNIVTGAKATVSGNATITGGYAGIGLGRNTELEMTGGTVAGTGYGIAGNGSNDNTTITISGGSISGTGVTVNGFTVNTAIFHPQVGNMTISGGEISGMNGVQYSGAGTLTITGGKITATYEYTEFPSKSAANNDGSALDGAALSLLSRGTGYQDGNQRMNVKISGGEFISENNSAIAVYRLAKVNNAWVVGDATNLPSYLGSLTITEGENGTVPVFSGNPEKGVLDIEARAMGNKSITGGTFNQDIDAGEINYVDEDYESHEVQSGYSYAGWYNVHKPVADRADCVTCTPPTPPTTPTTTYYTLTIRYVDAQGNQVAPTATRRLAEGSRYTVDSPAVEGMTPDQETVTGILNSRTEITVTYAADENVDDNQTPTTEAPETSEPTETQKPDETQPPETEEPGETEDLGENDTPLTETPDEAEDLGDNDTPLADVPQTGDMLWLWILLAVVSASGLIWISLEEKKGHRVA